MSKLLYELNSKEELEQLISQAVQNALTKSSRHRRKLNDELLTTKEICDYLKLSRGSIWALEKNGIIPFLRIGNAKRYSKVMVLERLIELNKQNH